MRVHLQEHHQPGFRVVGVRGAVPTGHVLNIDHFRMSQPTFPPHPHAGFAALTYVLPDSPGAMDNRDGLGGHLTIEAGALHCTLAGRGVVHEERPLVRGVACHGLQIFIKLARVEERVRPSVQHVTAGAIPALSHDGVVVRVLLGEYRSAISPAPRLSDTTLLHVTLEAGGSFSLRVPEAEAFLLVLDGAGDMGGEELGGDDVCTVEPGEVRVTAGARGLSFILGHSESLPEQVAWAGPFCMFDREALRDAYARYRAGEMGHIRHIPEVSS